MNISVTKPITKNEVIDPFKESVGSLIVVVFPKSGSKNFPLALSIAQGANRYAVTEIGGTQMHIASFARNQADAGRASALLDYIGGWKGVMMFSCGKVILNTYSIAQIIDCYLEACACRDIKAHCQRIIDDPFSPEDQYVHMSISIRLAEKPPIKQEVKIYRYVFPCKQLLSLFIFQKDHPSSVQDQIQAAGVGRGCDICPHFSPDDFKVVGDRTIVKDFFE